MKETDARFDLLKTELSILESKINGTVDRLWKIRALSITLWSGAVAIGLGAATGDNKAIPELLVISTLLPILFWWIDATYNSWYLRFVLRENAISEFFNLDTYVIPATKKASSFKDFLEGKNIDFPVFDISGHATFASDRQFMWKTSKVRCIADIRPLIIFGGQLTISTCLAVFQCGYSWRWFLMAPLVAAIIFVSVVPVFVKNRIMNS